MFRKTILTVAVISLCMFLTEGTGMASGADNWPDKSRPVTMLIPFAAGGGTDFNARLVAKVLSDQLGLRVNSINRTGGQGVIGHTAIAQGTPDGYTMGDIECELNMMHWAGLTDLTYRDVTPIAMIVRSFGGLHVKADSPHKTAKELFDAIKTGSKKLKGSGAAHGGIWHLCAAGMLQGEGISIDDIIWVPNEGSAPSLQDLAAGGLDFVVCSFNEAGPLIAAGKIRTLASISPERLPLFPDVPTLKEATGNTWILSPWGGIAAPGGLPEDLKVKLGEAMKKVCESQDFQEAMKKVGKFPVYMGPDEFKAFLAQDDVEFGKVMKAVGIVK
ncbi:MAG: tripartite tricarboxylate transporter substrate binding protein [Synergistaceae bacterium]|nr:tripartite tricarboxylate transporter substrate binding protein [Synergistaceae bacterium]